VLIQHFSALFQRQKKEPLGAVLGAEITAD
jgi:hypothetical protein